MTAARQFFTRWRNTLYSGADHLWLLLLWAVSTPLFIQTLGLETFGVWVLINTVIGMGGVVSFGFGEATIRYVAQYRGLGQPGDIARIVDTTLALYALVGLITALGLYAAAPWLAEVTFKLDGTAAADAITALRLAGGALVVTSCLKTWEAVINGFERFDLTARAGILTRSFIILGNLALALVGFGLVALIACTLLGLTAQAVAYFILCRRHFVPGLRLLALPDRTTLSEIAGFGLQSWLQICAGALNGLADRFLVGALLGPSAAGVYAICLQLAQQIHLLLTRGLAFLMPLASRATADTADRLVLMRSYRASVGLTLMVGSGIGLPLAVLAPQILTVWVGAEFAAKGAETLRIMALYFAAYSGVVPAYYLLNGAGRPGWNTITTLVNGAVGLMLTAALLPYFGLEGAALARVLALPLFGVMLWAVHRHVLGTGTRRVSLMLVLWPVGLAIVAEALIHAPLPVIPASGGAVAVWGLALALAGATTALIPHLLYRKGLAATPGTGPATAPSSTTPPAEAD